MPSISTRTVSPTFSSPSGKRLAHGADPGRCTGGDHVAGLERERLREVGDLLKAAVDHLARVAVLAQLVVDPGLDLKRVRVAELVGGDDPRTERTVGIEGLAHRHRRRAQLPVADGDVVGDRVAGDHLVRAVLGNVATARADHDRQLALVVEQVRDAWHVDVRSRADHAGDLLVEEDRELRRLHAALRDMVGVVEPDRQVLARLDRGEQSDIGERVPVAAVAIDDFLAVDDAVARPPF